MKSKQLHPQQGEKQEAQRRIAEVSRLYERIRALLEAALAQYGKPDGTTTKVVLSKMSELSAAHLAILKAEDTFHEKFNTTSDPDEIDFEAARDTIGRQLDRIRAAIGTEDVS